MVKFEYKRKIIINEFPEDTIIKELNNLGEQGWDVINIHQREKGLETKYNVYLKRIKRTIKEDK